MNQRIKELANKAGMVTEADFASGGHFAEKFAQLIVRECIELNRQELAFNAFARMLDKYNEHFGVEE